MFYTWIPIRKRHDETLTFCYFNLDILSYYVFLKHSSTLNYPDCERFERPNAKKRVFVFQARRRMTTWLTTLMPQPILSLSLSIPLLLSGPPDPTPGPPIPPFYSFSTHPTPQSNPPLHPAHVPPPQSYACLPFYSTPLFYVYGISI